MIENVTMSLGYSLGLTGRTRSINDISKRVWWYGKFRIFSNRIVSQIIYVDHLVSVCRRTFCHDEVLSVGHKQTCRRVRQNLLRSTPGDRRIEWHIKLACL